MKCSYTILISALLGGGVFAANSKLNQYASISDWYITSGSGYIFDRLYTNELIVSLIKILSVMLLLQRKLVTRLTRAREPCT
jgi:hypothetical protein